MPSPAEHRARGGYIYRINPGGRRVRALGERPLVAYGVHFVQKINRSLWLGPLLTLARFSRFRRDFG